MASSEIENPKSEILKIAIVGPESTGKSTMSAFLANHYQTVWVPEFAREYCEKLTEPPAWQDEINMFYGQLALEEEYSCQRANQTPDPRYYFHHRKNMADQMFGRSPQEVLNELPEHPYDLYLLLNIDLPWQDDPLRDFPNMRERPHGRMA